MSRIRPILFSSPMVRAILDGRKTQTRRVLKPQPRAHAKVFNAGDYWYAEEKNGPGSDCIDVFAVQPPYAVGDRLWVRETWAPLDRLTHNDPGTSALAAGGFYKADGGCVDGEISRWTPAIYMPRRASRLTLTVTDVRIERVQDISEADAIAEGVDLERYIPVSDGAGLHACGDAEPTDPVQEFRDLWDSINAKRGYGWDANPWVCAVTFTVERRNIDAEDACRASGVDEKE